MGQSRWFLRLCDGMVTASSRGCPLASPGSWPCLSDLRNLRRPISDSGNPPVSCLICEDEGQYVNWKGKSRRSAAGVNASDVGVRESIPARVRSSVGSSAAVTWRRSAVQNPSGRTTQFALLAQG